MEPGFVPVLEVRMEETLEAVEMLVLERVRRGTRPTGRAVVDLVVIVVMLEVGRGAVVVAVRAAVVEREAVVLPRAADIPDRDVMIGFLPAARVAFERVVVWVADRGLLAVAVGIGFLIVWGTRPTGLLPAADTVPGLEMIFAGDPFTDACLELSLISISISFRVTSFAARSFSRATRRSCLFLIASTFAKKGCSSSAHPDMQSIIRSRRCSDRH